VVLDLIKGGGRETVKKLRHLVPDIGYLVPGATRNEDGVTGMDREQLVVHTNGTRPSDEVVNLGLRVMVTGQFAIDLQIANAAAQLGARSSVGAGESSPRHARRFARFPGLQRRGVGLNDKGTNLRRTHTPILSEGFSYGLPRTLSCSDGAYWLDSSIDHSDQ
jgi:hypothetical protein